MDLNYTQMKQTKPTKREKKIEAVEVLEIWQYAKSGTAYDVKKKKPLKLVAFLVGGLPLLLDKEFVLEKRLITKEEAEQLTINQPK